MTLLLLLLACAPPPAGPPPAAPATAPPLAYRTWTTGGQADDVPLPLVVALHGLGDTPDDFRFFLQGYEGDLRVLAPAAPIPFHGGGSWLEDVERADAAATAASLSARADAVVALLDDLRDDLATVGRPVVTGFSQGGMLTYTLAVRHPEAFAGAVPVSGYLPIPLVPAHATPEQAAIPVRGLHGADDERIPTSAAERTVADLHAAGADATLRVFPGVAHAVPRPVHDAMLAQVTALVEAERARAVAVAPR